jgi:hypothetical protein
VPAPIRDTDRLSDNLQGLAAVTERLASEATRLGARFNVEKAGHPNNEPSNGVVPDANNRVNIARSLLVMIADALEQL